jgi:uncharacterized membrane protein YphA (DoxX/SURF4 family)
MNKFTALFLILLRLTIGWHFFAEGFRKLEGSGHVPTVTVIGKSKPFSSAGYFREGAGPLAKIIRQEVGDPDEEALQLLTPDPHTGTPPLLHQEWADYIHHYCDYYSLNDDQRNKAEEARIKAEAAVVSWLTSKTVDEKNFKAKTQEGRLPVPLRLEQYKHKLEELSEPKHSHLVSIGSDAESVRLHSVKAEAVRLRVGLLNDLDEYTQDLRKDLEKIPTREQRQEAENKGKPPEPQPPAGENTKQKWIDLATMYGLTILGVCLMFGLFTRLSCLLAAGFLVMTYLIHPPFPWLPSAPNNEGYYLFVNKNVIECLALLALATTSSGRWLGLDALIHWMLFGGRVSRD